MNLHGKNIKLLWLAKRKAVFLNYLHHLVYDYFISISKTDLEEWSLLNKKNTINRRVAACTQHPEKPASVQRTKG